MAKDEAGVNYCSDCGFEINTLDFSQEWRWFGPSDNRFANDPDVVIILKVKPKGVQSVFNSVSLTIPPSLLEIVDLKYNKVLEVNKCKILRGDGRRAIVGVCLFYSYPEIGEYRTAAYIQKILNINQRNMSIAMKIYLKAFPNDRTLHITADKLIPWIMKLTNVPQKHYETIIATHKYLSGSSKIIERSAPQSVAAATIYFYLCLFPEYKEELGLNKINFAAKAKLSAMTIFKLVTTMAEISGIPPDSIKIN